jgi:hypothetical protein
MDYKKFEIVSLDKTKIYSNPDGSVFNPGMILYNNIIHFAYRAGDYCFRPTSIIIGQLNKKFKPAGIFRKLSFALDEKEFVYEDPRFFTFRNRLFLSVAIVHCKPDEQRVIWVKQGIVDLETNILQIIQAGHSDSMTQKNWIFFEYGDELFCTYSLFNNKHIVCKIRGGMATPIFETSYHSRDWLKEDVVRGTSNMVLKDGLLWGVAHTRVKIPPLEYTYVKYSAIFYAINSKPPFNVVYIQGEPFLDTAERYRDLHPNHRIWCMIPSGLILSGDNWILASGINDSEISIMKIPCKLIEQYCVGE